MRFSSRLSTLGSRMKSWMLSRTSSKTNPRLVAEGREGIEGIMRDGAREGEEAQEQEGVEEVGVVVDMLPPNCHRWGSPSSWLSSFTSSHGNYTLKRPTIKSTEEIEVVAMLKSHFERQI
jgi:hypothetical protein